MARSVFVTGTLEIGTAFTDIESGQLFPIKKRGNRRNLENKMETGTWRSVTRMLLVTIWSSHFSLVSAIEFDINESPNLVMEYHWDLQQPNARVRLSSLHLDYGKRWPDLDESFDASESSGPVALLQLKSEHVYFPAVRPVPLDESYRFSFSLPQWLCPRRKRNHHSKSFIRQMSLPDSSVSHSFAHGSARTQFPPVN